MARVKKIRKIVLVLEDCNLETEAGKAILRTLEEHRDAELFANGAFKICKTALYCTAPGEAIVDREIQAICEQGWKVILCNAHGEPLTGGKEKLQMIIPLD